MASYDLNAMLRHKAEHEDEKQGGQVHLDDVSRVKILSPGRRVFKRFIRNRLAVFGVILLAFMFIFSFLGPLVYPYGQKQQFYKYDTLNVNYGLAKENTTYTGYTVDPDVTVSRNVASGMTTTIKSMTASDRSECYFSGDDGSLYKVERLGDSLYSLSKCEGEEVAVFGGGKVYVGELDAIARTITYSGEEEVEGLADAAAKGCKGNSGEFTYKGVTYSFEKGTGKKFNIYKENSGFAYSGKNLGEDFEAAAQKALESGESFKISGKEYAVEQLEDSCKAFRLGKISQASLYTCFTIDFMDPQAKVTDEFRINALQALYSGGRFTAGGESYTIKTVEDIPFIYDASGAEYAELSTFVIRRYNGEDTMEYGLKKALSTAIEEMLDSRSLSGELTYAIPQQTENGEYAYDENGKLTYNDTLLKITQKDTGEYVINCDQITYMLDLYAKPSISHVLGTDGDGFDVMARIMYGGRVSLMVSFVVVFLEIFLGIIMGGLAGYYGGWVDNLIMRLVDIFYCLPSLPIMIILGAMMDALRMNTYIRLLIMMGALGIMGWAGVARMVRGQILSLREQEFMVATEATGIRVKNRIFRHLVPNVMPQLIVIATMGMGSTILTESTLSFLGLGVKHPLATWGTIINSVSSASAMAHYAHIWIPVGVLICLTVIAFNFVGDGLRDAYDPKAKR